MKGLIKRMPRWIGYTLLSIEVLLLLAIIEYLFK